MTEIVLPEIFTYSDYLQYVREACVNFPEWRPGQAAFNVLREWRPDLSEKVRCTQIDPFYNDERLDGFFVWVEGNWNG